MAECYPKSCSFNSVQGTQCTLDSAEIIQLLECKRDIRSHKSLLLFGGIETEVELILARSSIFAPPRSIADWTVCPAHRASLGLNWRRRCGKCVVPISLSHHHEDASKRPKAERGLSKTASQEILRETGIFLAVGSGVCSRCRKLLGSYGKEAAVKTDEGEVIEGIEELTLDENLGEYGPVAPSTPAAFQESILECVAETPARSLYLPSDQSVQEAIETPARSLALPSQESSLDKLNAFLGRRDISPIRYTLKTPWGEASGRTQRRYIRKAMQVTDVVFDEIVPGQSDDLWKSVLASKTHSKENESDQEDVDTVLMQALSECYTNANTWETRRQMLSVAADKFCFETLKKWIPGLTKWRFTTARKHALLHGRGLLPPKVAQTRMYVTPKQVDHFLEFITSPHVIQDVPFGEKTIKLSSQEVIKAPNVIRVMIPESIVTQYLAYASESDFKPLSRRCLLRILSVCSASHRKSLQGLDYISAAGAQAFDDMHEITDRLAEVMGMSWAEERNQRLKAAKRYLKSDFKVHVARESTVADHCLQYALSDPKDRDFQVVCTHDHCDSCDRCHLLSVVLKDIEDTVKELTDGDMAEDDREQLKYKASQAKQNIIAWKAHLLRSINQDEARTDVLQAMDQSSALAVQDWAMKFLPRKFRESQTDWFAKRGLSWHITVATRKMPSQEFGCMTFVHIFRSCNQDSGAVLAVMDDVIGKLKEAMPSLTSVFYRQDNAGCYRSGATIVGARKAGQDRGVSIRRLDFCDPQSGKGPCDRKAASIKAHMRIYVNEGHDVNNAEQMVSAIKSQGGVSALNVTLCDASPSIPNVKLDGVSSLSNIEYNNTYLRVWKAYNIGPGKRIDLRKISMKTPNITMSTESDDQPYEFCTKKQSRAPLADRAVSSTCDTDEEVADTDSKLFCCPEEGCIKSYQRLSSLQHHLDCGNHERMLERHTLLDKAALGYAMMLEGQSTGVPHLHESVAHQLEVPLLPMGWALRAGLANTRSRFSAKQKEYLISKFKIGEATGRKFDPATVAKSMQTAKDSNGERLFSCSEFLSTQQVSSFFSRLASKRALVQQDDEQDVEADDQSQETEAEFSGLREEVMDEVMIRHPICYDNYNICALAATNKLSKFSVAMLKEICEHFEISTESMKKLKAPFIAKLNDFVKSCTCQA